MFLVDKVEDGFQITNEDKQVLMSHYDNILRIDTEERINILVDDLSYSESIWEDEWHPKRSFAYCVASTIFELNNEKEYDSLEDFENNRISSYAQVKELCSDILVEHFEGFRYEILNWLGDNIDTKTLLDTVSENVYEDKVEEFKRTFLVLLDNLKKYLGTYQSQEMELSVFLKGYALTLPNQKEDLFFKRGGIETQIDRYMAINKALKFKSDLPNNSYKGIILRLLYSEWDESKQLYIDKEHFILNGFKQSSDYILKVLEKEGKIYINGGLGFQERRIIADKEYTCIDNSFTKLYYFTT